MKAEVMLIKATKNIQTQPDQSDNMQHLFLNLIEIRRDGTTLSAEIFNFTK